MCSTNTIIFSSDVALCDVRALYIDLIKRTILNTVYEPSVHREFGEDFPKQGHSMIGWQRMTNIQTCIEDVLAKNNVPGDFIETGVWRGGATIFMRAMLKAYGIKIVKFGWRIHLQVFQHQI